MSDSKNRKLRSKEEAAPKGLVDDIRRMVEETRASTAAAVNAALTTLHWRIGKRISEELLHGERATYGKEIVSSLSRQLENDYGKGFSAKNVRHKLRFHEVFPDEQIVSALRRQLSWTHLKAIIYMEDPLKRNFYAEMCRIEGWSTRTLQKKINSMLYERTALSKKPEETIEHELTQLRESDQLSPDLVFKDPYILDFLGLNDRYLEKDLEDAILRDMENFLLELGTGFAFVARQKRIQIDSDDFYLDLLFYNRKMQRLIALELKLGDFKPEHKGQMELYLRWLAKHEQEPEENTPLGIILCAGKKQEQIELMELGQAGIHVAEYLTALPSKELLAERFHAAIKRSRERLENRTDEGPCP